jgi:hypothetical protein
VLIRVLLGPALVALVGPVSSWPRSSLGAAPQAVSRTTTRE